MHIITSLSEVAHRYDALFCDLWGCLHNGQTVFPEAVSALLAFRKAGGSVVLLTNAPRPRRDVAAQLAALGAPRDCYDAIVTSGDAAQAALVSGMFGKRVHHIGPDRDLSFFEDENGKPFDVSRVPLNEAEGIVCTGLFDDTIETPQDYRLTIATGVNRGLKLLCANPDVIVDRGETRIYCAGAIAEAYSAAGGESRYFGKPHAPIYQMARQALSDHGTPAADDRILCIGDGVRTDIQGGVGEGLDTLLVTGGLAAEDTGTPPGGQPEEEKLIAWLAPEKLSPTAAIGFLR